MLNEIPNGNAGTLHESGDYFRSKLTTVTPPGRTDSCDGIVGAIDQEVRGANCGHGYPALALVDAGPIAIVNANLPSADVPARDSVHDC